MRYTICSNCRTLFGYTRSTCPVCETHHSREMVERIKLCPYDGTPMPVDKSFCPACGWDMRSLSIPLWIWPLLLIAVSFMHTWFLGHLRDYVSTTFQPASCLLQSAAINTNTNKDADNTYYLTWNYTVLTKQGYAIESGQGRMGLTDEYATQDEAQQAIQTYQVGSVRSCWYSSWALFNRALLVQADVNAPIFTLVFWLVPLPFYALLGMCAGMFYGYWRLFKYGRSVVGTVVERVEEISRQGIFVRCTVAFKTQTKPALSFKRPFNIDLRKRKHVDVLYDPLYPSLNVRLGDALTLSEFRAGLLWRGLALLLVSAVLASLTILAFAF